MKVFISSLITGMEAERAAAKAAVESLRHQPVMAESFGARASSPQVACLGDLRASDVVVLILAERYGYTQPSGFSATHEEFREAKDRKPVLVFVKKGAEFEGGQKAFVDEAGRWASGALWENYTDAEDLRAKLTHGLHALDLARSTNPEAPAELARRARDLLQPPDRHGAGGSARLRLAVAFGPHQTALRPTELEQPALAEDLEREAVYGAQRVFSSQRGTQRSVKGHALVLEQPGPRHGVEASLVLSEDGSLVLELPLGEPGGRMGLPMLIEEHVQRALATGLGFAATIADRIDPTRRLTHIAVAVRVDGAGYMGWRTEAEHAASPNSASTGSSWLGERDEAPVQLSPPHRPRAALSMDRSALVEDLTALLRRRWKA